jgi:hypothetical protein
LVLLIYWVDHDWYFPRSHGFYSFLNSYVHDYFSSPSVWKVPLSIFCIAGWVDMNCFAYPYPGKVLISPPRLKDSFAGYSLLGWQLFSVRAWTVLLHAFLAFGVCAKRSEVILMCLSLYVSWHFSFFCFLAFAF